MVESQEPSYYEIALTHRQVLFGFVILLVCLMAAFFSGVWMGRGGETAQAAMEPAREEPVQATTSSLPEVNFFSEKATAAPAGAAKAGSAATPVAGGKKPVQLSEEAKAKRRARIRRRREEEARKAAQAQSAQAAAQPPAAKPATLRPATPKAATPKAPAATGSQPKAAVPSPAGSTSALAERFVIQVLSTRERAKAQDVVNRLKAAGYSTLMSTIEQDSQVMYRVRLGPYPSRAEADGVADKVRRGFKLDTWVTSE